MSHEAEILNKATELFFQYGVRSVTMDDLSKALGISKKTLYQFVDNKSDIVCKSVENFMFSQTQKIRSVIKQEGNAVDELVAIGKMNLEIFKKMHPSSKYDLEKYYPEAWQIVEKYKCDFMFNTLLNNLERGKKELLYRENVDNQMVVRFYTAIIEQLVSPSSFPSTTFNFIKLYKQFIRYHLNGIATEKGVAYIKNIDFENE